MPSAKTEPKATPAARKAYAAIPCKTKTDDPGRYTKTPHEYGDVLISGGKLGGALQRDLIYWIERNTWGDPKRPEWAKISLTQFARLCQSWDDAKEQLRPVERKSVAIALADLEKRGIIESRDRKGCGPTTAKMYKLSPERWKKATPYKPPTPKEIEAAEDAADAEPENDADETADQPAPAVEQTVANGETSRPTSLSFRPARDAEPITLRVIFSPTGFETPITFRARTGGNGRIQITATPARLGESQANGCSHGQPQLRKSPVDNKAFEEFETAAQRVAIGVWGYALDDNLIRRIWERLGGETPAALFERVCEAKLITGRKHHHTPGLLVNLAEQARRAYATETQLHARQRARRQQEATNYRTLTDEEIEALLAEQETKERSGKQ